MRVESHLHTVRGKRRGREIERHATAKHDGGRTLLVAEGLGLPRTHGFATQSLLAGFEAGLAVARGARGLPRLRSALTSARDSLVARAQHLIEHAIPDVALVALAFDAGDLSIVCAGNCRVYLHRTGATERLTPTDACDDGGLLARVPFETTIALEPNDLVLAGSVSAFSSTAVARVRSVLGSDPNTPVSVIATLLSEPAEDAGIGAGVAALRVV